MLRRISVVIAGCLLAAVVTHSSNATPVVTNSDAQKYIVLSDTRVDVVINNDLAQTTVTQHMFNSSTKSIPLSMDIVLPRAAHANSLSAVINGRAYKAVVREKATARSIVSEARKKDRFAALVEENDGILHLEFSKVLPCSELSVTFSYIQKNSYSDGEFHYSFDTRTEHVKATKKHSFKMAIEVSCTAGIISAGSSTHRLEGGVDGKIAEFNVRDITTTQEVFEFTYRMDLKPGGARDNAAR
ncbi:MAG: VIT domain-containing protein [Planctomycetota bacterium]|nr:VIT domain-containing protein [Planctomycetota bacterium]